MHTDKTLILLTWSIGWAPNNAGKWQMGFNLAFKGFNMLYHILLIVKIFDRFCFHPQRRFTRALRTQHTAKLCNWVRPKLYQMSQTIHMIINCQADNPWSDPWSPNPHMATSFQFDSPIFCDHMKRMRHLLWPWAVPLIQFGRLLCP
jgi:hypothetical protein